jgi:transposase
MTDSKQKIILGVDTHKDFHHAALITGWGEPIADQRFEATPEGYDLPPVYRTGCCGA